jgi:hypothetical protein
MKTGAAVEGAPVFLFIGLPRFAADQSLALKAQGRFLPET